MQAANLKRWLNRRANDSSIIRQCKALFDKIYGPKTDASQQEQAAALSGEENWGEANLKNTPNELKALISVPQVALPARLHLNGVVYARASTHLGNSLVLFHPGGDIHSPLIPGSIQYIYAIGGKTSCAVHQYHRPSLESSDPFTPWPEFPAQIWSTRGSTNALEEVPVSWIQSHFAQLAISNDNVVVLDLSRI